MGSSKRHLAHTMAKVNAIARGSGFLDYSLEHWDMAASVVAPSRWVRAARAITMSTRNPAPAFSKENDPRHNRDRRWHEAWRRRSGAGAANLPTNRPATVQDVQRRFAEACNPHDADAMAARFTKNGIRVTPGEDLKAGILAATVNVASPERRSVRSIAGIGQVAVRTTRASDIPQIRLRADVAFERRRPHLSTLPSALAAGMRSG